jgi:phage shock protein A
VEEKMGRTEAEAEAMEEARDVLERPTGSKMTQREIEARFADLENGATGGKKTPGDDDVDDELQALRKKFRVAP